MPNSAPTHEDLEVLAQAVRAQEEELKPLVEAHKAAFGEGPPYFSRATASFWQELHQGRFHLCRCAACSHLYFPPRVICPECWAEDQATLADTPGIGVLVTFTELHVMAPVLRELAPIRMAVIDLDEGVRILTWLRGPDAARAKVGDRCRIVVKHLIGRAWFVANLTG